MSYRTALLLLSLVALPGCRESGSNDPCSFSSNNRYPAKIVDYQVGGTENLATNPLDAEGAPDCAAEATNELSLGGGFAVYDLGCQLKPAPGPEFIVWESAGYCGGLSESYAVRVSADRESYLELGQGSGETPFDVSPDNIESFRYIRIEDRSGVTSGTTPGTDLDALQVLQLAD